MDPEITGDDWPEGFNKLSAANHCLYDVVLRLRFELVRLSESLPIGWSRFGVLDFENDRFTFVVEKFRFGPFEWLWRSLSYWRLQPILKSSYKRELAR